jgi:uncharacterized membrane protein
LWLRSGRFASGYRKFDPTVLGTKSHRNSRAAHLIQQNWRYKPMPEPLPSSRVSAGVGEKHQHKAAWGTMLAGAALSIYGWTRKSASGAALGVAGGAIALKAASAGPIADMVGTETSNTRSVVIMRTAADVYAFWKDFGKAPLWMEHVQSVSPLDDRHARWIRKSSVAGSLEWITEVVEDVPNRSVSWRIPANAHCNCDLYGNVVFNEIEHGRGTAVTLSIRYKMHAGLLHSGATLIIGQEPARHIGEDLRRFKMLLEAGEIATIQGQSHGPRRLKAKLGETLLAENLARGKASERLSRLARQRTERVPAA